MAIFDPAHPWQFTAGVLANLISLMVFLAPLPTFYGIYKRKSAQKFHSIPYVAALFSCTLWAYYALVKTNEFLLITINVTGCVIETIYISIFIAYAPKKAKLLAAMLLLLSLVMFGCILLFTILLTEGPNRVHVLGWICVAFSACVFAAPLTVMRRVVRTKSVKYLPFWLSFFLALSAMSWFFYGFLMKDIYIAIPNVLGFTFGLLQMILYFVYKKSKNIVAVTDETHQINSTTTVNYKDTKEGHVIDIQAKRYEEQRIDVQLNNFGDEMVESHQSVEPTHTEPKTLELSPSPIVYEKV